MLLKLKRKAIAWMMLRPASNERMDSNQGATSSYSGTAMHAQSTGPNRIHNGDKFHDGLDGVWESSISPSDIKEKVRTWFIICSIRKKEKEKKTNHEV